MYLITVLSSPVMDTGGEVVIFVLEEKIDGRNPTTNI